MIQLFTVKTRSLLLISHEMSGMLSKIIIIITIIKLSGMLEVYHQNVMKSLSTNQIYLGSKLIGDSDYSH